ncbi:MAG: DUF58 domain-containing protein [Planctomycetota bacterium]
MAVADDGPRDKSLLSHILTSDFCPWANRFVYWLKEPIGWFFLATIVCVLVGRHMSPIGWTLAACLVAVMAIGVVWPWFAVNAVVCRLGSDQSGSRDGERSSEGELCYLILDARNRFPVPVWGLAVEGFLDRSFDVDDSTTDDPLPTPTVALAFVRALATCRYRFSIRPDYRGHYPDGDVMLTCSFPFGIWTAKRKMSDVAPVTVWPKSHTIDGQPMLLGKTSTDIGDGNRVGRTGDFIGVRPLRHGDGLRQINWIASARTDQWMVTERTAPECPTVTVAVDVGAGVSRDSLSDRIRVAASVLTNLHQASIPMRLNLGDETLAIANDRTWVEAMDRLASIPMHGWDQRGNVAESKSHDGSAVITIASDSNGDIEVSLHDPAANVRRSGESQVRTIRRADGLEDQLHALWWEVRDANMVA